ncbi:MAG TPA: transposase [Thermoanaerobaculaceae bacterium]|nr:transposase [Thermoanaerobaculaceae bacterium]HPS79112.1 transposase [Thermoanaerobaculaceae bacterium]
MHALVTRGGWDRSGAWTPVPFVDGEAAALVLRHRVFRVLQGEGLLSAERTRLLLSWRHSGFSVHTSVTVPPDDPDGRERLARYLLWAPVSLDRLRVNEDAGSLAYAGRRRSTGRGTGDEAEPDALDFLARVVMHIPEPRRHVIRYYGAYSSVVRARRARQAAAPAGSGAAPAPPPAAHEPASLEWRAARRRWAQLIRRIYEVDPLVCPRCGGPMRIVACITESRVIGTILRHLAAKGVDARSPPGADPSSPQRTVTAA